MTVWPKELHYFLIGIISKYITRSFIYNCSYNNSDDKYFVLPLTVKLETEQILLFLFY